MCIAGQLAASNIKWVSYTVDPEKARVQSLKKNLALLGSVVFSPTGIFEVSVFLSTGRGDGVGENFAPDYQI